MNPVILFVAALAAFSPHAFAAEDVAEARVGGDKFVAGGSVSHSKPVDGDLIGIGGNFDLRAGVGGDAVLGGGDVRIRDGVAHNLFAGGGNVHLESRVGRNARLAGGNVVIATEASIGGNLSVAGGTVEVRGPVSGSVHAAAGDLLIDSSIGGDVTVAGGRLEVGPNARIGGRINYRGPEKISIDSAAQVSGGITRRHEGPLRDRTFHVRAPGGWLWALGLIALAALIAAFPVGSRRLGESLRGDPALALVIGFITLVCVPVAAILLMVTIIGIPLAIVLLLLYFLVLLVGYAAIAVVIGDTALARFRSADAARTGWRVGAAMAAMTVLALLTSIPYLGKLALFAVLLAGLGAVVLAVRAHRDSTRAAAT